MWRLAFLCSAVLTLTVACGDGPGAPSVNTDELSLGESGDPPPPPLEGRGFASFSPSGSGEESIKAAESEVQQVCDLPIFAFVVEGDYFQNTPGNHARIHFTPVGGSGKGNIHETENKQDASGSIVADAVGTGEEHQIKLLDYDGSPLLLPEDSFGAIGGRLDAVVDACGERTPYTGFITFEWGVPPPYGEGAF